MGLDISHNTWHGSYGSFMTFREKIAEVSGVPPLRLMEGFYEPLESAIRTGGGPATLWHGPMHEFFSSAIKHIDAQLPIKWESLKENPLHELLYHSDCDGEIAWENCKGIADELTKILPLMPEGIAPGHIGDWRLKTQTFIDGCMRAYNAKENLTFG